MENSSNKSTLEILPDEILLKICKYLQCCDILYSFIGLNYRMTCLIAEYRHHVSIHKLSLSKFHYLCMDIFPQIGSQIRSLVLDSCYSVLGDVLFLEYFSKTMSIVFPNLERISLFIYQPKRVLVVLDILNDLNYLTEIRLYNLFSIESHHQSTFVRSLCQANNHRLTTVLIDDMSSSLCFNKTDCYLNVLQLRIQLKRIKDLSSLSAAVPNVEYLDVIIEDRDQTFDDINHMKLSSLEHLTNFRIKAIKRAWTLEDLTKLLVQLRAIRCLSLFLCTTDERLIQSDIILSSLPTTIQQFNYAIYFFSPVVLDEDHVNKIVSSWSPTHPIVCYFNKESLFIHTLPWQFGRMESFLLTGKAIFSEIHHTTGYDRHVEQLFFTINKNFTYSESLTALSNYRQVRELHTTIEDDDDIVKEEKLAPVCLPKLSRLTQASFYGLIPANSNHFLSILNAAPNLSRLDLSFNHLLRFIENPEICHILGQHITSFCIFGSQLNSSLMTIEEKYVPIIASALPRVDDIYVDMMHLPCSTSIQSDEDILQGSFLQNVFVGSDECTDEIISPFSNESMLLCILNNFKEHNLIALCIDGLFIETIQTDPEKWLRSNTILSKQRFKASFRKDSNRLLIRM